MIDTHTAAFWDEKWRHFHWLFKFTARHADLNTCHNYKNLEILKKWGVEPAMVVQFFNPQYDLQKLKEPLDNEKINERVENADLPVMMVNRFAGDDDWETVIKTAEIMPEATFFITGRPTKETKKMVEKKGLQNVFLTGYLKHEEFMKLMAKCAVVLAFTLRRDTVLWSIREALALHKPFVTTDSQVLKYYFGDVGLFVSPHKTEELKEKIILANKNKEEIKNKQKRFLTQDQQRWEHEIKEVKEILKI